TGGSPRTQSAYLLYPANHKYKIFKRPLCNATHNACNVRVRPCGLGSIRGCYFAASFASFLLFLLLSCTSRCLAVWCNGLPGSHCLAALVVPRGWERDETPCRPSQFLSIRLRRWRTFEVGVCLIVHP